MEHFVDPRTYFYFFADPHTYTTLLLEICVKFCVKYPSLAHRAGVKFKGQIGANHLKNRKNMFHF